MAFALSIPRGSIEYIESTIPSDVPLTMGVEMSLTRGGSDPVWLPAEWKGDPGTTRTARSSAPITFDDNYPHAAYTLSVRLSDSPEIPIIRVGTIYILGPTGVAPSEVTQSSTAVRFAVFNGTTWPLRPTSDPTILVLWVDPIGTGGAPPGLLGSDIVVGQVIP